MVFLSIYFFISFRFEIQDLNIKPIMPELICLSESYIQVYEADISEPQITIIEKPNQIPKE